jgi:hypothetical protein
MPEQIERALKRAINSTARWAADAGRSGIARTLRISIKALEGRVRIGIRVEKEGFSKAWFGLRDISSGRLHPVQTTTGARAEGLGEVPHAFVQHLKSGQAVMFRRRGPLRYPIDMLRLPIADVGDQVIAGEVFPRVEGRLLETFKRELEREVLK